MCRVRGKWLLKIVMVLVATSHVSGQNLSNKGLDSILQEIQELDALAKYEEIIEKTDVLIQDGESQYRAKGYHWRALAFDEADQPKEALVNYYEALDIYQELNDTSGVASIYNGIAVLYYGVKDLKRGKRFLLKSLSHYEQHYHPRFDLKIADLYFNLGNFYLSFYADSVDATMADSALYYFDKAEDSYQKFDEENQFYRSLSVQINRTQLFSLTGDQRFEKEIMEVVPKVMELQDSSSLSLLYAAQARFALNKGNSTDALRFSDTSLSWFPSWENGVILHDIYRLRADIFKFQDDLTAYVKFNELADSVERKLFNTQKVVDLEMISVEYEKKDLKNELSQEMDNVTESFSEKISLLTWLILGAGCILLILLFRLFYLRKKKRDLQIMLDEILQEKQNFEEELSNYRQQVIDQQNLNEDLTDQPSSFDIVLDTISNRNARTDAIEQIIQRSKQVDSSFLVRLKRLHPSLNKNELALCVYLLIGMTSKDIAAILHIEPASVDRRRYRLRKKLDLKSGENLINHLEQIEHNLN